MDTKGRLSILLTRLFLDNNIVINLVWPLGFENNILHYNMALLKYKGLVLVLPTPSGVQYIVY